MKPQYKELSVTHPSLSCGAAALTTLLAVPAIGQQPPAPLPTQVPVVAIVTVPKPWYAPRFLVVNKMRETIPQYAQLPGLAYKMYSFAQADGQFGGIYFWRNLESAQAWFSPEWHARVQRERGVDGTVRFFTVQATVDTQAGGPAGEIDSVAVATLALASPGAAKVDGAEVVRALAIPGLLRRHYVQAMDGRSGMLSVWRNVQAARSWAERQGAGDASKSSTEWFDVPILTPSKLASNFIEVTPP